MDSALDQPAEIIPSIGNILQQDEEHHLIAQKDHLSIFKPQRLQKFELFLFFDSFNYKNNKSYQYLVQILNNWNTRMDNGSHLCQQFEYLRNLCLYNQLIHLAVLSKQNQQKVIEKICKWYQSREKTNQQSFKKQFINKSTEQQIFCIRKFYRYNTLEQIQNYKRKQLYSTTRNADQQQLKFGEDKGSTRCIRAEQSKILKQTEKNREVPKLSSRYKQSKNHIEEELCKDFHKIEYSSQKVWKSVTNSPKNGNSSLISQHGRFIERHKQRKLKKIMGDRFNLTQCLGDNNKVTRLDDITGINLPFFSDHPLKLKKTHKHLNR